MSDEVDLANDLLEIQINRAVTKAGKQEIPFNNTGKCLYCDEPVADGRRWCDADCRELHEHRKN